MMERDFQPQRTSTVELWQGASILHIQEVDMPIYEFMCEKCQKPFTLVLSISEYEKKGFRCPTCKSTKVKQQISPFQTKTSRKS